MRALRRVLPGEEASGRALGLDGRRPLRPFRLSVLTTAGQKVKRATLFSFGLLSGTNMNGLRSFFACLPSLTIPTARHFWKRQYWHRFLLRLSTGQLLAARHTYLAFFCTVRCTERSIYVYYSMYIFENAILHFIRLVALGLRWLGHLSNTHLVLKGAFG